MSCTGSVTLSKSCFLVHKLERITSYTCITVTGHLQMSVVASGGLADRFEAGVGRGHRLSSRGRGPRPDVARGTPVVTQGLDGE